jgi:Mrp family chromosome partitioning ATPase
MFGITERPTGDEAGLNPVQSRSGIAIMSINLLLPNEDEAVVWRGPLIARAISQFWEEVRWGRSGRIRRGLVVRADPGTWLPQRPLLQWLGTGVVTGP